MKKPKDMFNLPNGKTTTSAKVYIAAWRKFAKPICQATGATLYAFDPGVDFMFENERVQLPARMVKKLNQAILEG